MFMLFLSFYLIFFSLIMIFTNHPLSLGMLILLQTFLMSMLSGMMINSYWFSYILFLTFMGGLLVLFIYVSSIASNELFKFSFFMKLYNMFFMMMILILSILFMNKLYFINFFNIDMNNLFNMFLFFNIENNINLSKLYNEQTYFLMMMLIIYLFITLIAVIKITNIFFGPLRSFN